MFACRGSSRNERAGVGVPRGCQLRRAAQAGNKVGLACHWGSGVRQTRPCVLRWLVAASARLWWATVTAWGQPPREQRSLPLGELRPPRADLLWDSAATSAASTLARTAECMCKGDSAMPRCAWHSTRVGEAPSTCHSINHGRRSVDTSTCWGTCARPLCLWPGLWAAAMCRM